MKHEPLRCSKCGSTHVIRSRTGSTYCKEPGCGHAVSKSGRPVKDYFPPETVERKPDNIRETIAAQEYGARGEK